MQGNEQLTEGGAVYMITGAQLESIVEMTVRKLTGDSNEEKRYLTASEVTAIYGISATSLWRWQKMNILHPKRVGNRRRYDTQEIEKVLNK